MNAQQLYKIGAAIAFAILILFTVSSTAQTQANTRAARTKVEFSPETKAAIEQKVEDYRMGIEERARQVLDREFLRGRSLLIVRATPNLAALKKAASSDGTVALTTLPNSVSSGKLEKLFIDNLPVSSMKEYVSAMVIDVTIDKTVPEAQRKIAEQILKGSLNLPRRTRIRLQIADLSTQGFSEEIERVEKERRESEMERQRLADDAARANREKESVVADKRSTDLAFRQEQQKNFLLTQELDNLKSRIIEYEEKIRDREERITKYEEEISVYKTPLGDIKKLIKGLELPLTMLPIFVMLLGVILVFGFIFNATAKKKASILKESIEIISGSVTKLGSKMQRSGDGGMLNASAKREGLEALHSAGNAATAALPAHGDILAEEATSLKRDAESAWQECWNHRFLTLCELREWLAAGPEGRQRFLSLVSALPPSDAAQILGAFSPNEIRLLKDVVVDLGSKFMGYSLILSLHRAVLGAMATAEPFLAQVEATQLIMASDTTVAKTLGTRTPTEQAVILRMLPASRWTRVLETMAEIDSAEPVAEVLVSLAEPTTLDEKTQRTLLVEIEKSLATVLAEERSSHQATILDDLVLQMEVFSPRLKAALQLAQRQSPELAEQLRNRTITIDNVLMLDNATLQELLEPLDSEQIAQILIGLEGEQQQRLGGLLQGRLRATVLADMQRLAATPTAQRRNSAAGRRLQSDLVERLRTMADQGLAEIPRSEKRSA